MRSSIDIGEIYAICVSAFGYEFAHKSRRRDVADAKAMASFVAYINGNTYQRITDFFHWSDHTTAMAGSSKMRNLIKIYPEWKKMYLKIEDEIEFRKVFGILAQ